MRALILHFDLAKGMGRLGLSDDEARRLLLQPALLAGVQPGALRFALQALAPQTCLEQAEIDIVEPPGLAWCAHCGRTVEIEQRGQPCPGCGDLQWQASGGDALRVLASFALFAASAISMTPATR